MVQLAMHSAHSFTAAELVSARSSLLQWYDVHQREMPWRHSTVSHARVRSPAGRALALCSLLHAQARRLQAKEGTVAKGGEKRAAKRRITARRFSLVIPIDQVFFYLEPLLKSLLNHRL